MLLQTTIMSMATNSIPSLSSLCNLPSSSSHAPSSVRISPYHGGFGAPRHRLRRGMSLMVVRAVEDAGNMASTVVDGTGSSSNNTGEGGGIPDFIKWLTGPFVLVAIPIWRRLQNADKILDKADEAVEKIEDVADRIGNVAREIAEELPEGGRLQEVVLKVQHAAEDIEERADSIDNVLDKISESIDDIQEGIDDAEEKKEEAKK